MIMTINIYPEILLKSFHSERLFEAKYYIRCYKRNPLTMFLTRHENFIRLEASCTSMSLIALFM